MSHHKFKRTAFLFAAAMQAGIAIGQPQPTGMPANATPLIERELFFDNPEIAGSQLSPDGKMISFLKANDGIMNIWVKSFDEPFEKARPLTASKEPMSGYFWSYDGKYILFSYSKGGNENDNIYAVNPLDKADPATGVPEARNLTPNDKVKAYIYNVSKKNPDIMWVGLNERDERWHDLYKLEISTGKLTLLEENKDRLEQWVFDWDENIRLALRSPEDGSTEILKKNADGTYTKIYDCPMLESVSPIAFTKDNKSVYIETNKGKDVDLSKLVLMNLTTLAVKDVEKDPLNKVDFGNASFSDLTHELEMTSYTDAKTRRYFKNKELEADYNYLLSKFPGMEISMNSSTSDEQKFLVSTWSDDKLPEVYFFDRKSKKLIFQYNPRPKLKPYEKYFGKMEAITYKSSDGLEIPAYLSLPKGQEAKNLPLIVLPHGGPWARDYWGFSGMVQWLTNRGYAVLQMNFRSSTGYGKKFINAGNKQWGMLMQDDITWGVKDMVQKGIADPKRVAIMGGSYGGYATLAGLTFTPDVYAAGVDIVGPSNLLTLLNSIPAYWEAGRKVFTERMGDPATPEGKALLEKQSPLNSANKIKAPLMIIQGANDPRVKKAESDQIVIALRNLNREVIYLCAPDEGHGYHKPVNNMAALGKAEEFLGKHLHARYQESMKPEIAQRLNEITVNVDEVTLAEKVAITAMKEWPKPSADLKPATYNYDLVLEMQGQKMPMQMTRTVKEDNGKWMIKDAVNSPMGEQSDAVWYSKGTLAPVSRTSSGGGQSITYTYAGKDFTSNIMGKTSTVSVAGAYIPDGGGNDMLIGRLPLKEGYETGLYIAGQDGKATLNKLSVKSKENINGASCYKCEMVNADDPTDVTVYYINPEDKMAYRIEAPVAQVPGAKMTIDLKK
jgi:dipeptidyl aminopeptidase/acylaminoacyl peptidase